VTPPDAPEGVLAEIAARALASAERPVLLVDGGSGAGKSTLAAALLPKLGTAAGPAQLVSLDELYPGWDGLAAGARKVAETVLREEDPGWRRWDWPASAPAEWNAIDPLRPLVVEGCGALSSASRARASLGLWIELDAEERRRRALAREPGFAPWWERWAAQEAAWREAEPPGPLADIVLEMGAGQSPARGMDGVS